MRIATQTLLQQRQSAVQRSEARLTAAQDQVSSGKRLVRPSDDPTGTVALLQVQGRLRVREQQSRGIQSALPVLGATDSALGGIADALSSAQNAALRAANSAVTSPADRAALAAQIHSAAQVALGRANTQVGGRYVFGGTASDRPPFSGDPVAYTGDATPLSVGLGDPEPFAVSVPGSQIGGGQGGADLFANLSQLEDAVRSGDPASVRTAMDAVKGDFDRVVALRGDVGARVQYVEMAQRSIDQDVAALQARGSELEDVDLASAVVAEKSAENQHAATLAMAGRLGAMSLLDYLR